MLQLQAWELLQSTGGRSASLGRCSVALNDFWSCHNNPAGFAYQKHISIGLSYENRFMLKELGLKKLGLIIPSKAGHIGLSVSQFGYEHYNENIFGLCYSKGFGPRLSIGVKLDYILLKFSEGHNNISTATFEIGMQYNISESLCIGTYIFNPIHAKTRNPNNDKIPIIMRLGLSYKITDDFFTTSEIEKGSDQGISCRLGMEYEIYDNLFMRSGFQLKPEIFTFGLGYEYKKIIFDICGEMHSKLGASINCSLIFKIKNKYEL